MPPKKSIQNISTERRGVASIINGQQKSGFELLSEEKALKDTFFQRTRLIELEKIRYYDKNEFRKYKKKRASIEGLEESISAIGLASPILLRENYDEDTKTNFEVLAGSRRYTAYKNLHIKALESNDRELIDKYSKIPAFVLPKNITVDEALRVYEDTNLHHEGLDITDMFNHLDAFLERDANGKFIRLPEGRINIAKLLKDKFDRLGCDYSLSQIKKYVAIWLSPESKLKDEFRNGYLTFNQCYTISQMPAEMQTSTLEKFSKMTEQEINQYLKTYNLGLKIEKEERRRSVDVINDLSKVKKTVHKLELIKAIDVTNKEDVGQINKEIDELITSLKNLKKKTKQN